MIFPDQTSGFYFGEDHMKTAGIIVEYNPFHNGHQHHLLRTRELADADFVVAVMSGDFVQRGEPALLDKYARAQMALSCGADLVLELPVFFAAGSAGDFAAGAVSLLDKLGVVDALCFGSECGRLEPLEALAGLLAAEPPSFSRSIRQELRQGLSYPQARARALSPLSDAGVLPLLSSPNNILGLEYCIALKRRRSSIRPLTLPRSGNGYHDPDLAGDGEEAFPSAFAIRRALCGLLADQRDPKRNPSDPDPFLPLLSGIPQAIRPFWQTLLSENRFLFPGDFTPFLKYRLLCGSPSGFSSCADVSRELSDKLRKIGTEFLDWEDLCRRLKTKELTYTRISRALCHILLSVGQDDLARARQQDYVPYARILGLRRSAAELLSAIKKNSSIPLIAKLADAPAHLSEDALRLLRADVLAADLYENALALRRKTVPVSEYRRQFPVLP